MELRRTVITGAVVKAGESSVPPNVVVALLSETVQDRIGDVVEAAGCRMNELKNGVAALWQHDTDHPIARCNPIWRSGDRIMGRFIFPPPDTSDKSDEALRLIKAGVVDSVSIGFAPHKFMPIGNTGGLRFTDWSLLEVSFVSLPALPSAVVTAKTGSRSATLFLAEAEARLAKIKRATPQLAKKTWQDYAAERREFRKRVERVKRSLSPDAAPASVTERQAWVANLKRRNNLALHAQKILDNDLSDPVERQVALQILREVG